MSEPKKLEDYYEEDPSAFNKGFELFCKKLQDLCIDFHEKDPRDTPSNVGFKFAASICFGQLSFVMEKAAFLAAQEEEAQNQIKNDLEKLFNM